jgi:hypothetical protein
LKTRVNINNLTHLRRTRKLPVLGLAIISYFTHTYNNLWTKKESLINIDLKEFKNSNYLKIKRVPPK